MNVQSTAEHKGRPMTNGTPIEGHKIQTNTTIAVGQKRIQIGMRTDGTGMIAPENRDGTMKGGATRGAVTMRMGRAIPRARARGKARIGMRGAAGRNGPTADQVVPGENQKPKKDGARNASRYSFRRCRTTDIVMLASRKNHQKRNASNAA